MRKNKLLKAYPFLEEVDSFSLEVAQIIDKLRPHWLNISTLGEFDGNKYLSIEFRSPVHSDTWRIVLYTDHYDITVAYYDSFHVHFNRSSLSLEQALKAAFELIDDIIREKSVVGFILLANNEPYGHAYDIENMPTTKTEKVHYIRSWRGTYDKNLLEE